MFSTIFKQEIKYWFQNPAFYIYAVIFLVLSIFLSAASTGLFDDVSVTTGSGQIVNSPIAVNNYFNTLSIFIYFFNVGR